MISAQGASGAVWWLGVSYTPCDLGLGAAGA